MANDYWHEAVACALDDAGLIATSEQIQQIAGSIAVSHENYGMACGHDVIPSPANTSKDREIAALKQQIHELEGDIDIYRGSVARRHNIKPGQVYLDRYGHGQGNVMIEP